MMKLLDGIVDPCSLVVTSAQGMGEGRKAAPSLDHRPLKEHSLLSRFTRRAFRLAVVLAVPVALALPCSSALAFHTGSDPDYDPHVVITADGSELTPAAQDLIVGYVDSTDQTWRAKSGNALKDLKRFVRGFPGRLLPRAGAVAGGFLGGEFAYEVCSGFIRAGCWLFSYNQTGLTSNYGSPQYNDDTPRTGNPNTIIGNQFGGTGLHYPGLEEYEGLEFWRSPQSAVVFGHPWNPEYHCWDGQPPSWHDSTTLRSVESELVACYHGSVVAPPDGYDYHPGNRGTTVSPVVDDLRPTPDTAIPNQPGPIPYTPDWAKLLADYLRSLTADQQKRILQYLGYLIDPDHPNIDPYTPRITVPDCSGLTYSPCAQRIRDAGFEGTITRENETFNGADVTKPADAVLSTRPPAGSKVYVDKEVVIRTNPDDSNMPRVIPEIEPGETYEDYADRLRELELNPSRKDATEITFDYRPDGAMSSDPRAGVRVHKDTDVEVTARRRQQRCDLSPPLDRRVGDPGIAGQNPLDLFTGGIPDYPSAANPVFTTPLRVFPPATVLRWGSTTDIGAPGLWDGFGYRHIAAKHGWGPADDTATRTVLRTTTPSPDPTHSDTDRWTFVGPPYAGLDGRGCERFVVVDYTPKAGDTQPAGIITSFGRGR